TPTKGPGPTETRRANELRLAGLRPGVDLEKRAVKLHGNYAYADSENSSHKTQAVWTDGCHKLQLTADFEAGKSIEELRVNRAGWLMGDCVSPLPPSQWKTGRGLRIEDEASHVVDLYGQPTSRSPSTKNG